MFQNMTQNNFELGISDSDFEFLIELDFGCELSKPVKFGGRVRIWIF